MDYHWNIPKSTSLLKSYLAVLLILMIGGSHLTAIAARSTSVIVADTVVAEATASAFEISPSTGVLGKEYEVLVTSHECLKDPSKTETQIKELRLYAPAGSGIIVANVSQTECRIAAKVTIAGDAPLGATQLWLVKKDANPPVPQATVSFNVTAITQGPTPTGKGIVDVHWDVLPDKVVKDNFGNKVARQFYCIDALIGNDSGFDLQLSSIGFTLPNSSLVSRVTIPTTGYRTVRGSMEAFGQLSPRKFVLSGFDVLGPLLTGFIPFFHVAAHKANFSEFINIVSNPLEKGIKNFWPDLLPTELDRLADQMLRDDVATKTVLPNNVQTRILTFVPKQIVFPYKGKSAVAGSNNAPASAKDPNNPRDVMTALGDLVIVGREIDYINRIRVVNSPFGTPVTDHTISGKVTDACNAGVADVEIALNATDFVERKVKTDKNGAYTFANIPDGRTYTVTPKFGDAAVSPSSSDPFPLNDTKTNLNFSTGYVITGKIKSKDGQPLEEEIPVKLSGGGLASDLDKKANIKGEFTFVAPASGASPNFKITASPTKYTVDGSNPVDWKCDKRDASFSVIKK